MVDLNVILGKRRLLPAAAAVLVFSASLLLSGCDYPGVGASSGAEKVVVVQPKDRFLGVWQSVPGNSRDAPERMELVRNGDAMIMRVRVGRDNFSLPVLARDGHWFVHLPGKGMGGSAPLVIEQETGRLLFGGAVFERLRSEPAAPSSSR